MSEKEPLTSRSWDLWGIPEEQILSVAYLHIFIKELLHPGATYSINPVVDSMIKKISEYIGKPLQDSIKCILALEPTSVVISKTRT